MKTKELDRVATFEISSVSHKITFATLLKHLPYSHLIINDHLINTNLAIHPYLPH